MSTLAHLEPGSESITNFDRLIRARIGKQSLGLSPPGLMLVYLDWLVHLEFSPAKRLELLGIGLRGALRLALYAARSLADPGTPAIVESAPEESPLHRSRVAPVAFQSLPTILPPDAAVVAGGNDKRVGCVATEFMVFFAMTIVEHVYSFYDWSRQNRPQVQKPFGLTLKLMPFGWVLFLKELTNTR